MLLSSLEGEHVPRPALDVPRPPDDAPRHLAHVLLSAGEEPQVRPSEAQGNAQRLSLAHGDVRAVLARGPQQPQRYRLDHSHVQGAGGVGRLTQAVHVLQVAEEVGLLDDQAGVLFRHTNVFRRHAVHGQAAPGGVGAHDGLVVRVHGLQHSDARRPVIAAAIRQASARALAPSYMPALATSMPSSSQTSDWNSKAVWSVPWLTSG